MLNLLGHASTPDKIKIVTSTTTDLDVHASYVDVDNSVPPVVQDVNRQVTNITTATTTDVCGGPGANKRRNVKTLHIRNDHASNTLDVTVLFTDGVGATDYTLWKATLKPGEALEYVEGVGFFEAEVAATTGVYSNRSTSQQGAGFASDTYLNGSNIPLQGLGNPVVGLLYTCEFDVTKTAAGTATPIITLRTGTAGTTGDTSRLAFTFGAGTAAVDVALVRIKAMFRAVGSGTSAVLIGVATAITNLSTTGWSNAVKTVVPAASGGFDSTASGLIIGCSYNGGTSASHTIQLVTSKLELV